MVGPVAKAKAAAAELRGTASAGVVLGVAALVLAAVALVIAVRK